MTDDEDPDLKSSDDESDESEDFYLATRDDEYSNDYLDRDTEYDTSAEPDFQPAPYTKKTAFYVGLGLTIAAAICGIVAFFVGSAGIYLLFAALLCSLAAISFLNTQKRRNNFSAVRVMTIINYVILALIVVFMVMVIAFGSTYEA